MWIVTDEVFGSQREDSGTADTYIGSPERLQRLTKVTSLAAQSIGANIGGEGQEVEERDSGIGGEGEDPREVGGEEEIGNDTEGTINSNQGQPLAGNTSQENTQAESTVGGPEDNIGHEGVESGDMNMGNEESGGDSGVR